MADVATQMRHHVIRRLTSLLMTEHNLNEPFKNIQIKRKYAVQLKTAQVVETQFQLSSFK